MSDSTAQPKLPPPRVLWGRVATAVVVVLVAFGLGRCTAEGVPPDEVAQLETQVDDLQSSNDQLRDQVERLDGQLAEADTTPPPAPSESPTDAGESPTGEGESPTAAGEGQPGGTWTVTPGDTLHAIAIEVYDDHEKAALIAAANGLDTGATLDVGQVLQLPLDQ